MTKKLKNYLMKLLNKEAFDRAGLIYGIGHAVIPFPTRDVFFLRNRRKNLPKRKGLEDEFELYDRVERLAPQIIGRVRKCIRVLVPTWISTQVLFIKC